MPTTRGIAGIVAAILLIVILAAAIVLIISVQRQLTQAQETAAKITLERQQLSLALQKSIFSYMIVYTNLSKATLMVRNAYTQPILLKKPLVIYTYLNYTFAQPLGTGYTIVLYNESLVECPALALPITATNITSSGIELDPGCTAYINFTYTLEPATVTAVAYAGPSVLAAAATITAKKLYPSETAIVGVTPTTTTTPTGPTLTLYYRSAIVADNFSTNPFTTGRLIIVSGGTNWAWNPAGYILFNNTDTAGLAGGSDEAIVIYNLAKYKALLGFVNETIPTGKTVYSLSRIVVNAWYWNIKGEVDLYFSNATLPAVFLVTGLYRYYAVIKLAVYLYSGAWNLLSSTDVSFLGNALATPFLALTNITYSDAQGLFLYTYELLNFSDASLIGATSGSFTTNDLSNVTVVGLGSWYANVSYDDVLVTVGANPFFINVTGLPGAGWNVTLIEYSGTTPVYVVSGLSDADGNVYLNLTNPSVNSLGHVLYMFCNAKMEVYTPTGALNTTLASSSVPGGCFLGGDVYRYG